jgi:hypothetical protein
VNLLHLCEEGRARPEETGEASREPYIPAEEALSSPYLRAPPTTGIAFGRAGSTRAVQQQGDAV